jgi:ABC-type sulfate/molybdate transport systems ATPase subunit
MSVVDNVAYARRVRGDRKAVRRDAARDLLAEVGLAHRADDLVTGLSGGEQQRVALARALCAEPRVLLLDEPLTAVDAGRRAELRELIREVQARRAVTTVLVTHDLADATAVADTVAVVEAGRLVQHDRPEGVIHRPATPSVAQLTGNPNLSWGPAAEGAVPWTIRPEHVRLADRGIPMLVVAAEHRVTHVRLRLHGPPGELEALVDADVAPAVGRRAFVELPEHHVWRFGAAHPTPTEPSRADATATAPPVTDARGR